MQEISRIALIAVLAASATTAYAQEPDDILLEDITVTASTEAVELGRTGATVSVVTAEDLAKTGDKSVASLLARLPGVSMARSGGLGAQTALRLRGLSGPYIGVRIDGIDVADPSGVQCSYDFGSTTAGGISRIEVLRGSQSALFGSEAIGGVVEITSFRATEEGSEAQISLEAGSYGTLSGTAAVAMKSDRVELAFTASRTVTDGFSAYTDGTEDDAFRSTNLTFFGSYNITDSLTLGLNGFARDSFTEFDSQTADSAATEEATLYGLRLFTNLEMGSVKQELSFARTETERYYPIGFTKRFNGDRDQIAYKGEWDASEQLSLNWGLDQTRETFGSDADRGTSTTRSIYSEALYAANPDLDLSFALRYDDHSTFGGQASGRAALAWRPDPDWIIRAVASTGFRAPSLYELYSAYGNTGLTPEESRSFEVGAEYLLPGGSIQMTLFDTEIDNKIGFDSGSVACTSGSGCYVQIPGTTTTRGVELTGSADIVEGWSVFGNYTYADATNANAGVNTRLVRVPRHDLTLGVEADFANGWGGVFTVQHVSDFLDSGPWPAGTAAMSDYTVANLSVSYDITDKTQAYVRVENIFDADYETVRNYAQPGRSVYLGVQAKF